VEKFVELGMFFWGGYFAFWIALWFSHCTQYWGLQRQRYEELSVYASRIFLVVIGGGALVAYGSSPIRGELLAIGAGVAIGLAHFHVFPKDWWRARTIFWTID